MDPAPRLAQPRASAPPDPTDAHRNGIGRRRRAARLAPLAIVLLFAAALLYRSLLAGNALYWGDLFLYFYPMEDFVRTSLRHGRLPLWNPYVLCGQPLVGNPQSWVFYPSTLLLPFVPTWLYFNLNNLLHLTLAGWGTYLFLRRICADRLAALLGALAYSGSGFLLARLQFPTMVMSAAWLPWLLILVDRMVDRPGIGYAALMALVVALELLAAHTQIAYLTFGCATLYALARLMQVWRRGHRARAMRALGEMTGALLLGVLGAMVQLLPTLQLFTLSTREKLTWMQANRFVFLPEQLINFLLPTYYGHPARGDYWGEGNFWEPCVYIGVLPLLLAGYAAFRGARRPAARFFAVVGLLALWLAMGRFGGIYWFTFYAVPGLSSFHDPARFAFLTVFSFAALSAVGLRVLRDRRVNYRLRVGLVALAALDLWAFSAHINPTLRPDAFGYRPRVLAQAPRSDEGRVFTAEREQVWKRYMSYADYGPESARYAHELADTLAPNVGMRFDVAEGSGYEPVPVKTVTEVDALVRSAILRQSPRLPALLGLFNAQMLLLPGGIRYRHPALEPLDARGVTALAVRDPFPRAWLVRRTVRIDGGQRSLSAIGAPEFDPRESAIVSGSVGLGEGALAAARAPAAAPVVVTGDRTGEQGMEVDTGGAPAFLVVSQAWYPGWECKVDGRPAQIERANHAFIGVAIGPGRHHVVLRCRPEVFRIGLYLSLAAAALMACGMTAGLVARQTAGLRRSERNPARIRVK